MKDNILKHFAINDLKIHKKNTHIMMITLFITSLIMMMLSWLSPLYFNSRYLEYQKENGNSSYYGYYYNDEDINDIKPIINGKEYQLKDLNVCNIYVYGHTFLNSSSMVSNITGNTDIISLKLKKGRLPTNDNEIAIKQSELDYWGYTYELNKDIQLAYSSNEQPYSQSFKIVGLLEETGDYPIVISSHNYEYYKVYIKLDNNQIIENSEKLGLERSETLEDYKLSAISQSIYTSILECMIIGISFCIIYGLTLTSFEKKTRDYTLLKSIGITEKQMYYIIGLQVLILSIIPSLISMFIVLIFALIIPSYNNVPLPFDIFQMLIQMGVVIAVTFFSYFMPARKSLRRSLTGTFEGQIHQYIYYRYKKIHQLKPFYLAYRQLIGLKKQMIIKLFLMTIVTILMSSIIYPFTISQNKNDDTSNDDTSLTLSTMEDEYYVKLTKERLSFLEPYTSSLFSCRRILIEDGYIYNIYRINNELKNCYQIIDLKNKEIALSKEFLYQYDKSIKVGDTFYYDGHEFILKQIIDDTEANIFMTIDDYQLFDNEIEDNYAYVSFKNVNDRTEAFNEHYQEVYYLLQDYDYWWINEQEEDDDVQFNRNFLIVIIVIIAVYVYQYIFELYNQREDIGSYQLIGLTHKEISAIYFYKTLIVSGIGFVLGTIYKFMDIYMEHSQLDISYFIVGGSVLMILILVNLLCTLPINNILKTSGLENKSFKD